MSNGMSKAQIMKLLKIAVAILGVAIGLFIAYQDPPEGMSQVGMKALGILVWAVFWWVTQIIPEYVTAIMMCTLWAASGSVKFPVAFDNFSKPGWWIMIGAFGLGAVAGRTGLLRRISLWVLNLFPPSFNGQVMGLLVSGTVVTPLVPSMNAKSALSAPLAFAISDSLGIKQKSIAAAGLLGACYGGFVLMGHVFLSGSFSHYMLINNLPEQYRDITWMDWLIRSLPWGIVCFSILAVSIMIFYRPKEKVSLPKGYGKEQLEKIGPMSRDERIVLLVLVAALLMWMTEKTLHNVSSTVVALTAMSTLLGLRIMTANDFKSGIEWPAVVMIGCVFNMASVFKELRIEKYISVVVEPYLKMVDSLPLLIVVIAVSIYLLKFILANMTSISIMYLLILGNLVASQHVDPWIVLFVSFCAGNIWIFKYMNTIYLCSQSATQGGMAEHKDMVKLCFIYMGIVIIGALVSIPYWKMLGLIG